MIFGNAKLESHKRILPTFHSPDKQKYFQNSWVLWECAVLLDTNMFEYSLTSPHLPPLNQALLEKPYLHFLQEEVTALYYNDVCIELYVYK